MTTTSASSRAPFTCIWEIENVSDMTYINFQSPTFIAHTISDKEWFLRIVEEPNICCWFEKLNEQIGNSLNYPFIDAEFSLLTADGTPIVSPTNDEIGWFMLSREELLERWAECVPNGTLTVQCRMWKNGCEIPTTDLCYARTSLETYSKSFLWPIEEFSALKITTEQNLEKYLMQDIKMYQLRPFTPVGEFMIFILFMMQNSESGSEDVFVDFLVSDYQSHSFSYKVLLQDANGQVKNLHVERNLRHTDGIRFESPLISKNKLITNKNLLLPNDTLILKFSLEVKRLFICGEIEYRTSNVSPGEYAEFYEELYDPINYNEVWDLKNFFIKGTDENNLDDNKMCYYSCRDSCALTTALKYLHSESTQTDLSLRIGTKLYPVHKNILYSRSPVFKSIFDKDETGNIVDISGVDENTLSNLLEFIYTDAVGDLQFETTLSLYKAAADYQLLDLKDKCSDILKSNFSETSVCDILSLAKQYQDDTLENAARDFARDKTRDIE